MLNSEIATQILEVNLNKNAFQHSYKDPKIERQINELVGMPYSILERFAKGGIGSPKLFITRCSSEIYELLHVNESVKFLQHRNASQWHCQLLVFNRVLKCVCFGNSVL